jgi:1,4-dihydroxy-2-naphthoate octaprenyltransferase
MASSNTLFKKIFTRSQVFFFACSVLTYSLGTAAAHYLGEGIDWGLYSSGLILVLFIQAAMGLAHTYFKMAAPSADNQPPTTNEELESRKKLSYILLGSVAALLTASALIVFSHYQNGLLHPQLVVVLILSFSLGPTVVLPPVRLIVRGYGELAIAILICNLVPYIGFFLQTDGSARILSLSTFPLTTLFLAITLALEFEGYGNDCLYCHPNLLVKLGWQWGGKIHSFLLLATYVLIGIGYLNGLPWRIVFPFLFTVVLAILQIYLIKRIVSGEKPDWRLLNISSVAYFLLAVYLITYSFWMV